MQKYIYKINIYKDTDGRVNKYIPETGCMREIEIVGTPGAIFSLTIDDDDGCSLLNSPLNNVVIPKGENGDKIGKYTFLQRFKPTVNEKTYNINLTPSADVKLVGVPLTTPTYSVEQRVNPTVTLTNKTAIAIDIPTASTIKGTYIENPELGGEDPYGDVSISWTINRSEGASGYLYVKKQPNNSDWSNNVDITKSTPHEIGEQEGDLIKIYPNTVDLKKDMIFQGNKTIDKFVTSVEDTTDCDTTTKSIILNNLDDIVIGLKVSSTEIRRPTIVIDIDKTCNKIVISSKQPIKINSKLTFVKNYSGIVKKVVDNNYIETITPIKLPTRASLTFNKHPKPNINSSLSFTSGVTSPVVSGTVSVLEFGRENVTFTQDLDNIITYTPNAWDQTIQVTKDTARTFDLLAFDTDENYRVKTPGVVANPSNGTLNVSSLAAGVGTIIYTPTTGFIGNDLFTFRVNDGTTNSDNKTIYLKVK